ncbi:MAG TPA: M20/M25/M40 family metallo-hydrolase [Limnochordia bacterium]|nr:M20/M25/M40 family metallo-hydrolase [Limnochordia bacterium]
MDVETAYRIVPYRPEHQDRILEITIEGFEGVSIDYWIEQHLGVIAPGWQARKAADVKRLLAAAPSGVFVALAGDEVVGYVSLEISAEKRIGRIVDLAVDARHRRHRLGTRLLEHGIAHLRALGLPLAKIETLANNAAGQAAYPKLGFVEVARQIHYAMPLTADAGLPKTTEPETTEPTAAPGSPLIPGLAQRFAERPALDYATVAAEAVDFCRRLVQINTVNPYSGDPKAAGEAAGQDFLAPLLKELGAQLERVEPPADVYARGGVIGPKDRSFSGRPNLIATFTFGTGRGPRILLQGHMDTVAAHTMSIAPFSGELRDGRIWGRGASDMKGGMGAALAAVRELHRHAAELDGTLVLLSVVDEECDGSGAGALAAVLQGVRGDLLLCLDGAGPAITRGCLGCLTARLKVTGPGGHAAAAERPPSALERALDVAAAIQAFRRQRAETYKTAVNLGVFNSGVHSAMVPTAAEMAINITYTLEEARQAEAAGAGFGGAPVRRAFEQAVRAACPEVELEWVKDLIPFETPADRPELLELAAMHQAVLGDAPGVNVMAGWSDASYMATRGVPTLLFGAGHPQMAHAPDECVEVERVERAAKVLTAYLFEKLHAD